MWQHYVELSCLLTAQSINVTKKGEEQGEEEEEEEKRGIETSVKP